MAAAFPAHVQAGPLSHVLTASCHGTKALPPALVPPSTTALQALAAVHDGRGEALWNAAADLAGLPPWGEGSTREFSK